MCVLCVCVYLRLLWVCMYVLDGFVHVFYIYTIYAAFSLRGEIVSVTRARRGADKSHSAEQGDRNPDSTLLFLCVSVCVCVCVCVRGKGWCMYVYIYTIYAASSLRGQMVSKSRARRGTNKSHSAEQEDRNPDCTLLSLYVCVCICACCGHGCMYWMGLFMCSVYYLCSVLSVWWDNEHGSSS